MEDAVDLTGWYDAVQAAYQLRSIAYETLTEYNQDAKTSITKMLEGEEVLRLQSLYILSGGETSGNIKRTLWINKHSPDKKIPATYLLRFFWRVSSMSRTSRRLARLCKRSVRKYMTQNMGYNRHLVPRC